MISFKEKVISIQPVVTLKLVQQNQTYYQLAIMQETKYTKKEFVDIYLQVNILKLDFVSFRIDCIDYFWAIGIDTYLNNYVCGMLYFDFLIKGK